MYHYRKMLAIAFGLCAWDSFAQNKADFQTIPSDAKPRVWWHWMNGNVTKTGIQKDLDWMKRIGIGGFQNFDANLFTPQVVPQKLVFMTPEWKDAFQFTTNLAIQNNLEMAIAGSPGWSVTGGPWVKPEDGMKKYVWTEISVSGGKNFTGKLPQPSDITGKFGNVPSAVSSLTGGVPDILPKYYKDALVIAFKKPKAEADFTKLNPKVTSSGGNFSIKGLTDNDLDKSSFLPPTEIGQNMWVQYEFEKPQTFKAFSVSGAVHTPLEEFEGGPNNRSLQVSQDGITFKEVAKVSGSIVPHNTISFPATTAKYWRLAYKTLPPTPNIFGGMFGSTEVAKPEGVNLAEFVLYSSDRIDQFEDKAGFTPWKETPFSTQNTSDIILPTEVVDLTSKMTNDGTLQWQVPAGEWVIMRFGYSLTGRQNHPASPEATGLEVDKLDKEAVRKYINTYLDMYKEATGGQMGAKGLQYMILDSYEAGHMNWTKAFPEEFQKRRGYDIKSWIPVLAGRVIKSVEASERFLWDFRKTIGELIAENHYDVIGEELKKRGMKRYTESHENKRIYLADGMDVKKNADIPMSAMWTPGSLSGGSEEEPRSEADIRESASVANIYGKPIVAAESMTSVGNAFSFHPEKLKRTADLELASGLNRFVIHTSVHQPLDDKKPGFSLGPFGQYFTRHETWSEQGGKAWMEYLGRSCYLLQQGRNIADILYYYAENQNITSVCQQQLPTIPKGYEFDFVNASALKDAISAKNGKLVSLAGNQYSVLKIDDNAQYITVATLTKIKQLADAGVLIVGKKPLKSPTLSDSELEFQKLVNEIWRKTNVVDNWDDAQKQVFPQADVHITQTNHKILFRHRSGESEIYWLNNRSEQPTDAEISFRVTGKIPELWNAQTGTIEKVSYQIKDGRTIIPIHFESWDAVFVVFKENTDQSQNSLTQLKEVNATTIASPWKVSFGEKNVNLTQLGSWSENTDNDIKYFSGTATYENTFAVSAINSGTQYWLDLGEVKNMAEVWLNGRSLGLVWKKPFKLDISSALKVGDNALTIKVTNLWVNRLIGDAQPETKVKTTFTTMPFYQANSPLLPSGLLTEVKLIEKK